MRAGGYHYLNQARGISPAPTEAGDIWPCYKLDPVHSRVFEKARNNGVIPDGQV
jgi:hypothetical protein